MSKLCITILLIITVCQHLASQQLEGKDVIHYNAEKNYMLAMECMEKNDYQQAKTHLDAAIRKRNNYPDALLMRAMVHERLEEPLLALTDYNAIVYWQPAHVEAIYGRAKIRFHLQQYDVALEDFLSLLNIPIGETQAVFYKQDMSGGGVIQVATMSTMEADIHNYIGLCHFKMGLLDKALETYDGAIEKFGDYPDFYINRGQVYEKKGSWEMAALEYQKSLELDPVNAIARHNLSRLISIYSDSGLAVERYDSIIRNNPQFAQAYHDRALYHFSQGQYSKALADFDSAIWNGEKDPDLWLNRGLTFLRLGRPNRAMDDFDQCLVLNPQDPKGYHARGNALLKLQKYEDAISNFDLAINYDTNYGIAYYNRGVALLYLQKYDEACADLRMAEALDVREATSLIARKCN